METKRALLAIVISFVILFGYQYLFVGFEENAPIEQTTNVEVKQQNQTAKPVEGSTGPAIAVPAIPAPSFDREPREVVVETDLYTAIISEAGGVLKSFVLKNQTETIEKDSPGKQLINNTDADGYPLQFTWTGASGENILFDTKGAQVDFVGGDKAELVMTAQTESGIVVQKSFIFDKNNYLFDLDVTVFNKTGQAFQGTAALKQISVPYDPDINNPASNFLFKGPAAYINNELHEVAGSDLADDGPQTLMGEITWAGYEDRYFMSMVIPYGLNGESFSMQGTDVIAKTSINGILDTIPAGGQQEYKYHVVYGPKKLSVLTSIGFDLDKVVNYGWFDIIAKPTLWLLNFFYKYCANYGVAIILVTIMFKAIFWPITQKGMKSMKNMQKLQPKMVKLKEKFKDDPAKMNKEVMNLYKTYKVNPLGGCLPMVLQIPVFFALYKVLLLSIELRHAPFMLWINDLSAADRLWIGFDLPYTGGLPVLTLLMGASMFLQQKLSPTTADPTQAKIMMFLPVVFTFMFLNFASGLVLYWFVNNLLSILQQVLINRDRNQAKTA
ncbi:MAG: membrane protein insertase YidC [Desulfotalea sp.]